MQIAFDVNEALLSTTSWGKTDVMLLLKDQGFEIDIGQALDVAAMEGSWTSLNFIIQEWEIDDPRNGRLMILFWVI